MSAKLTRKITIPNELGLHARAAAKLAKLAQGARSDVYIVKNGQTADAASIMDVIGLYCPRGTEVTIKISNPKDIKILNRMARLIETGFGEM